MHAGPADGICALAPGLMEGASGLPVFSNLGDGDTAQLTRLQPEGYLWRIQLVAFTADGSLRHTQERQTEFCAGAVGALRQRSYF